MATITLADKRPRAFFVINGGKPALSIQAGDDKVTVPAFDHGNLIDALRASGERDIKANLIWAGLTELAESIRAESDDPALLRFAACLEAMAQSPVHKGQYDSEKVLLAALVDGYERDSKKL